MNLFVLKFFVSISTLFFLLKVDSSYLLDRGAGALIEGRVELEIIGSL